MAHFAKVENGIVTNVIVADQGFIDSGAVGDPSTWIQTSYNTSGGTHPSGSPLRFTYAGLGYLYIAEHDVFVPPSPHASWTLNPTTFSWEAPIPAPEPKEGKIFIWHESTQEWEEVDDVLPSPLGN